MISIYRIRNEQNGRCYVGSTKNLSHRKCDHFNRLRRNEHGSYLIQRDYDEGHFTFLFEVIEKNVADDDRYAREQWWIDNSNSYYNIERIAGESTGVKRRQETIDKIRKANLGLKHPEWRNEIKSLAQEGNNHWTKKRGFSDEARRKMSESHKALYANGYKNPLRKIVEQRTHDNSLIKTWPSAMSVENGGFSSRCVENCCRGSQKQHKGYLWNYK